eukprot:PITA_09955
MCKSRGKCCKLIIDSGSSDNLVATELVEKPGLKRLKQPTPYRVSWLQKGHPLLVNEQCEVEFHIGRKIIHDGKTNCYKFAKDVINHTLVPMKEEDTTENGGTKSLLLGGKKLLQQIGYDEVKYAIVRRPRAMLIHTEITDLLEEIQDMLQEFSDILLDDLPDKLPIKRSTIHHINFIPGASLPNKDAYRMSPMDNEEIRKQVQELLDKGLIRESLSPCAVPTVLAPKKGGEWKMCIDS